MRKANEQQCDILIVGGGMVGLTLACALAESRLSVIVLERELSAPFLSLQRDCRVSAIVAGNMEILRGIGVWPFLAPHAEALLAMRVWDGQESGSLRFEADDIASDELGCIVENSLLQQALLDRLHQAENVRIVAPVELEELAIHEECARVRLCDGRSFTSELVVGADGARSWVRTQAGIGLLFTRDYRQKGVVCSVRPERPHRGVALQRFLPGGPLAQLPLTGNLCSIVWSAPLEEADRLMQLGDAAFLEALNLAIGPHFGRIVESGARAAFPLKMQMAATIADERIALIGDAAHTIHPLAGLGVNLGIRDAMVLAQELVDARRYGEEIGSRETLARYAHARQPDLLSVMGSMEGLHRLFTSNLPLLPALRANGMRLFDNSGWLKSALMRNSTGLTLPVPKRVG